MTEVRVPTLGESVTEATVATWFKKVGDPVRVDEMLCELETDKVTLEVPSPSSGTITNVLVPEGGSVEVENVLAILDEKSSSKIVGNSNSLQKKPQNINNDSLILDAGSGTKAVLAACLLYTSDAADE